MPRQGTLPRRRVRRSCSAAVSVATASNALNSPDRVSAELRQRVHRAVDQLGYVPHAAAQSLRRLSRGKLVAQMVPNLHNPFFVELVEALRARRSRRVS